MSLEIEAAARGVSRGLVHELLTAAWAEPSVTTFGESGGVASSPPPAVRMGLRGFGVSIRVSDRTGLGLVPQVRRLLPPNLISGAGGPFHTEIFAMTRVDGRISLWGALDSTAVDDRASATRWLVAMIDHTIATEATEALFVHAGVVGWRGRALLVPGRSCSGKSTLITALVRHGAEYYSDEFAPIDPAGLVHAYARIPSLRTENGDDAVRLHPDGVAGPLTAVRRPLPVAAILATEYRPGTTWQPRIVRGARGLLPVIDNALVCRDQPAAALRAAKTLAGAVTLAGPRPDADAVAPAILERVDQLLAE